MQGRWSALHDSSSVFPGRMDSPLRNLSLPDRGRITRTSSAVGDWFSMFFKSTN